MHGAVYHPAQRNWPACFAHPWPSLNSIPNLNKSSFNWKQFKFYNLEAKIYLKFGFMCEMKSIIFKASQKCKQ